MDTLANGEEINANFIEGMGCIGGCVGGPRTILDVQKGTAMANEFSEDSIIITPFDNFNVVKILRELGFNDVKDIVEGEKADRLFVRTLGKSD